MLTATLLAGSLNKLIQDESINALMHILAITKYDLNWNKGIHAHSSILLSFIKQENTCIWDFRLEAVFDSSLFLLAAKCNPDAYRIWNGVFRRVLQSGKLIVCPAMYCKQLIVNTPGFHRSFHCCGADQPEDWLIVGFLLLWLGFGREHSLFSWFASSSCQHMGPNQFCTIQPPKIPFLGLFSFQNREFVEISGTS